MPETDETTRIGFYWHEMPQVEACRLLLQWMTSHWFVLDADIEADIELFLQTGLFGLSTVERLEQENRRIVECVSGSFGQSPPFRAGFTVMRDPDSAFVPGDVGYAPLVPLCGNRVIEIRLHISRARQLPVELWEGKQFEIAAEDRSPMDAFHDVLVPLCAALTPHYASIRTNGQLLPPAALLQSDDPADYADMFFWKAFVDPSEVVWDFADLPDWSVSAVPTREDVERTITQFHSRGPLTTAPKGVYVSRRAPATRIGGRVDPGIEIMRKYLRRLST